VDGYAGAMAATGFYRFSCLGLGRSGTVSDQPRYAPRLHLALFREIAAVLTVLLSGVVRVDSNVFGGQIAGDEDGLAMTPLKLHANLAAGLRQILMCS